MAERVAGSGDPKKVKAFWEGRAGQASLSENEVTHRDIWQRWLEIEMIKKFLNPAARVLDVGCGNGYTAKQIAPLVREIVGVDYGEEMIRRAEHESQPNRAGRSVSFHVADVLELTPDRFGTFDQAISERCLINLASWDDQQKAIANIAGVLRPGGIFLFVEGCRNGRERLNAVRKSVGLDVMPTVWHNVDFEEQQTLAYLATLFDLEHHLYVGVYDFLARVVHPLMVAPDEPRYEARINEVAAKLALQHQSFGHLSRVMFLVLRRKP
jgi:SAM-dependent methyltransferase